MTLRERFDAKWEAVTETGCWLWTACTNTNGYGDFGIGRKHFLAHRVSWEIFVGTIPDGLCVLHKCDTPRCVNPKHLFTGTQKDNARDKASKGRCNPPRGEQCKTAKLTECDVRAIRLDIRTHRAIADAYHVTHTTIGVIKRGLYWRATA